MNFLSVCMHRCVAVLCIGSLITSMMPIRVLQAQVQDLNAPEIRHTVVPEGVAGQIQTFDAVVFDDTQITRAVMSYRFEGQEKFTPVEMVFREKDDYRAVVPTEAGREATMEYYLEATDAGGNRSIEGFPNYFKRRLTVPVETAQQSVKIDKVENTETEASVNVSEAVVEEESVKGAAESNAGDSQGKKKSNALWLIVGGAAALVAVAALASGGDEDDTFTGTGVGDGTDGGSTDGLSLIHI